MTRSIVPPMPPARDPSWVGGFGVDNRGACLSSSIASPREGCAAFLETLDSRNPPTGHGALGGRQGGCGGDDPPAGIPMMGLPPTSPRGRQGQHRRNRHHRNETLGAQQPLRDFVQKSTGSLSCSHLTGLMSSTGGGAQGMNARRRCLIHMNPGYSGTPPPPSITASIQTTTPYTASVAEGLLARPTRTLHASFSTASAWRRPRGDD